jgi:hypothetical protein
MEDQHDTEEEVPSDGGVFRSLEGKERKDALAAHFRSSVGGLQPQINAIVRRVLDGRSIYSTHPEDGTAKSAINRSRLEAEELLQLGLQPVVDFFCMVYPALVKRSLSGKSLVFLLVDLRR